MTCADAAAWTGAIATVVTAVTAIVAVVIARNELHGMKESLDLSKKQLSGLNETLRNAGFTTVLHIEGQINDRKQDMLAVALRIEAASATTKKSPAKMASLARHLAASQESYLNAVDRLCYCILNDFVPQKDWSAEYRHCLQGDISNYPQFFGPDTRFRNIVKLHDLWHDG